MFLKDIFVFFSEKQNGKMEEKFQLQSDNRLPFT